MSKEKSHNLVEALRTLLMGRKACTQEDVCSALAKQGYEINQSKASRELRKIGAMKVTNERGQTVYSLPREPAPPAMSTSIRELIVNVTMNETLVVVSTSPGSASLVARVLDYNQLKFDILGNIAGDDTIFVVPKSIKNIHKLFQDIKTILDF